MPEITPEAQLADLLTTLFAPDAARLRAWLGRWTDTAALLPDLPGPLASARDHSHALAALLAARGSADADLFARLVAAFPAREGPIREVALAFGAAPGPEAVRRAQAEAPAAPPSVGAADLSGAPRTPATPEALHNFLEKRPILWVGAGTSVAAGLPGTGELIGRMIAEARPEDGPTVDAWADLPFFQAVDAFVASQGGGALHELLQRELGRRTPRLTPTLRAIAALAKRGRFQAIVTTNYDDLLEQALREAEAGFFTRGPGANEAVRGTGEVELIKLHGGREAWERVILSGRSYQEFHNRYPYWTSELDVLLRKHPILFVGCSLQDPRVLTWLLDIPEDWERSLKPWRALMTGAEWARALSATWERGAVSGALARARLRPLVLDSHAALDRLWGEVVPPDPDNMRLDLRLVATEQGWRCALSPLGAWSTQDPSQDAAFRAALADLHQLESTALITDERGHLSPPAAAQAARLRALAADVGERLTAALLPGDLRARLQALVESCPTGKPALLVLQVESTEDCSLADRALALPWELLRWGGAFPVEQGRLDLAREAVVPGLPGLTPPLKPLSVVLTVAAPEGQVQLDHEEESYRLWRALGADRERLHFTHWGTLDETVRTVQARLPAALHFTGHGGPGALLFETETAESALVPVDELVRQLSGVGDLPRLVFLASCHGVDVAGHARAGADQRQFDPAALGGRSTAACLHRAGLPQVVAYFGPVGDQQSTRTEAEIYRALAAGATARQAVHQARKHASRPHQDELERFTHVYPLGWAQLALYLRGAEHPTATPGQPGGEDALLARRERVPERIDAARHPDVPGVQALRFGFIGRRRPRGALLQRWLKRGARLVVVTGLGGLGKTALCAELLSRIQVETKVATLVLDGRAAGQAADPVLALWDQVQAAEQGEAWSEALAGLQKKGIGPEAVLGAVRALARLRGGRLQVYLDDAESLQERPGQGATVGRWRSPALRTLWRGLVGLARRDGPITVLASSRYAPEHTPEEACYPLPEMGRVELVRLMRWFPTLKQLPDQELEWLADRLHGHPRAVDYLEGLVLERVRGLSSPSGRYDGRAWRQDVLEPALPETRDKLDTDLLLPRLLDAVGPALVDHLGRCALLAGPAPWGAILAVQDAPGTGRGLVEAGLLSPFQPPSGGEEGWAPHRLVVEAVAGRWQGDAVAAHRQLGAWFVAEAGRTRAWEVREAAVFHMLAAGEADGVWGVARAMALTLRGQGRYREALALVERVLAGGLTGAARGNALAHRVDLSMSAGVIPPGARGELDEAQRLVDGEGLSLVLFVRARWARQRGDLSEAARALEADLKNEIELKGEEHPEVASSLHELAGVLQAQGDLSGARTRLERSLAIQARVFGTEEHPDVAASLHALAGVLKAQGDLSGARTRLERSLAIQARVFGTEEHPDVASSLHELAGVLQAQGDLSGARTRLERSLAIKARVFGTEEHPSVAASLHALAGVLQAQGDLSGARTRLERSLAIQARVFGTEEHPDVASSLHELAGVLQAQGDLSGARTRLERSLAIKARVFGTEEHPSVAASLHALAGVLQAQGDLSGARTRLERSLAIQARVFGTEEHPDVASSLHELAGVLQAQGDLSGARTRLERSLAIKARVFGTEEHPSVAASLHALAGVLQAQGDLSGARTRLERSLAIQARVFGTEEHPDVASSLHELAGVLQAQGDLSGARTRLERSLAIKARVFGTEEHPSVAASLHALAGVLQAQGDLSGARTRLERSLAIKARVFGTEEHPSVAASLHALAGVLQAQGDLSGARRTYERVLRIEQGLYQTRDHYSSGITELNLAQLLLQQGEREPAIALLQHALSVFERALPPGHPLTRQTAELLAMATGQAPAPGTPPPGAAAAPFAIHALAACAPVAVRPARLARLAFRVLLYAQAGPLVPTLLAAAAAAGDLDAVARAPEALPPPPGLPDEHHTAWRAQLAALAEARARFAADLEQFLPLLPRDAAGRLDPASLDLPEPDDDDRRALLDEAVAALQAARRAGGPALQDELDLWTHAARLLLQLVDGPASVTLAAGLLELLPDQRPALLAALSDALSPEQRGWLGA